MSFSEFWNNGLLTQLINKIKPGDGLMALLFGIGVLLCAAIPYLLGSINVSIIISRYIYRDDIRLHGSGNAGATNVMRTYGKKMAALTFLGDFLKAAVAAVFGRMVLGFIGSMIAGLFCIAGHIFPCFYNFKGGKGIVTACAMVLFTDWVVFLILLAVFIIIVLVTKFISLGSVVGIALFPIVLYRIGYNGLPVLIAVAVMALCIYAHRENIKRIMNHEERRFTFKVKDKAPDRPDSGKDK